MLYNLINPVSWFNVFLEVELHMSSNCCYNCSSHAPYAYLWNKYSIRNDIIQNDLMMRWLDWFDSNSYWVTGQAQCQSNKRTISNLSCNN